MFGGRTLEPICLLIEMMEGKGRLLFQEQSRNEEVKSWTVQEGK